MAVMNLDYYSGSDHYSDGSIEGSILSIVKGENALNQEFCLQDQYALSYHLSPIRQNILNWYPFTPNSTILEIGSGCGAITSLLCQNAKKVISVELSKKRAEINYERNRKYRNLTLYVGNLNDMSFVDRFDYIILNGVLEYAISYTNTKNPFPDFLCNMKHFLKDAGKIFIAIENRLGSKYFSGSREDHTGNYFLGLNNYAGNETVRTFSKAELSKLLEDSGLLYYKFYYPYPDYKFPLEIFTDDNINNGQYGRRIFRPELERVWLYDEKKVMDAYSRERIMDKFSNSFLVEASPKPLDADIQISYAKLNTLRKEEFRINTIIANTSSEKIVAKTAGSLKATKHLNHIVENENMPDPIFPFLKGCMKNNALVYPYLEIKSLDEEILDLIHLQKYDEIKTIALSIFEMLCSKGSEIDTLYTKEFKLFFGDDEILGKLLCVENQNVDIICDNLYRDGNTFLAIDGEWVCHFYVPAKFIIWRLINELFSKYDELKDYFDIKSFLKSFGINEIYDSTFRKWAEHFANKYVEDPNKVTFSGRIYPFSLDNWAAEKKLQETFTSSLYIDVGQGYSEGQKLISSCQISNDSFQYRFIINDFKDIKKVRWDPVENKACKCIVEQCICDGKECTVVPVNNTESDNSLFLTLDPQFSVILPVSGEVKELVIRGKLLFFSEREVMDLFIKREQRSEEKALNLEQVIADKESKLDQQVKANKELHNLCQSLKGNIEKKNLEAKELIDLNDNLKADIMLKDQEFQSSMAKKSQELIELKRHITIIKAANKTFIYENKKITEKEFQSRAAYESLEQEINALRSNFSSNSDELGVLQNTNPERKQDNSIINKILSKLYTLLRGR